MKNVISPVLRMLLIVVLSLTVLNLFSSVSRSDQTEVEKGKKLFQERGCLACHTIGKGKLTGPDLAGVTKRRDEEWLTKWLTSPETMIMSDPVAKQLLQEYMVPMPNQGLSPQDIEALIDYFEYEDSGKK
ncbi:MAG TPA: cytochrome c [Thermodesulfobacteriota bacterium]|nr:cytochrome c [Thermodesulfobacteriota bacterium]